MNKKRWMTVLSAAVATIITTGCGDSASRNSTSGVSSTTTTQTATTPNNTPTTTGSKSFSLANTDGTANFALVSSAVGSSDTDTSVYESSASLTGARAAARLQEAKSDRATAVVKRHDVMHRGLTRSRQTKQALVSYDSLATLPFYISETAQTVTLFNRTPGVLGNAGTRPTSIITYVEQINGVDVISASDLQNAINAWDTSNPFGAPGNTGIYNTMHQIFGSEWNLGGGNDEDTRVVCCFLSTATMGNPGLFGFVDTADELANRGAMADGQPSNGGEILYLAAQPSTVSNFFQLDGFDGYATMAHELEHLIIFNNKLAQQGAFPAGAKADFTTVDEGLATLAEDDCGFSLTASGGGNSFIFDVIRAYEQSALSSINFFTFNEGGDYGKGYLFFKYIQDTLGVSAITGISTSTNIGSANIAANVGRSFADQQQAWALANYVSGFTAGGAPYRYTSLNPKGTYSLHVNNTPADATSGTLPGFEITQTLTAGLTATENTIGDSPNYLNLAAGTGISTLTVQSPTNIENSVVQSDRGVVVNVNL